MSLKSEKETYSNQIGEVSGATSPADGQDPAVTTAIGEATNEDIKFLFFHKLK